MFIKLIILFSATALTVTFLSLLPSEINEVAQTNFVEVDNVSVPERLKPELLEIEKFWFETQKIADELTNDLGKKKNVEETGRKDLFSFSLDGTEYKLVGTFLVSEKPFVVLKQKNDFIKLFEGDELIPSYKLTQVQANIIAFSKDGKITEFKLFERNK